MDCLDPFCLLRTQNNSKVSYQCYNTLYHSLDFNDSGEEGYRKQREKRKENLHGPNRYILPKLKKVLRRKVAFHLCKVYFCRF